MSIHFSDEGHRQILLRGFGVFVLFFVSSRPIAVVIGGQLTEKPESIGIDGSLAHKRKQRDSV